MPWAIPEAATVEAQRIRFRDGDRQWRAGTDFVYLLHRDPDDREVLGMIGLHRRIGLRAIEIGYWTHVAQAGKGYMSAATKVATDAAAALRDVDRVEIHTDESNVRSAAIPRKLGYRLDRVEIREPQAPAECGRLQIWVLP
jgi:RimJ/RimL family protein N-acetyltransferase